VERQWPASTDVARGAGSRASSRDPLLLVAAGLGGLAFAALAYSSWDGCQCDKISAQTEAARLVAGLSFVAAGMLALAQERFRRVGILLTLVGWTWLIYEVGYVYQPLPYTVARLTDGLWQPLLAHLAVAFPSGRLRSRWNRLVVGSAYGLYAVVTPIALAFWHSRGPRLTAVNLLFVQDNPGIDGAVEVISQSLVIAVAATVFATVLWHWRTAGAPGRRALTPLLWASGPLVAVVGVYAVVGTRYFPSLLPLAMTALPVAFAVGLLQMRLHRAGISGLVVELGEHPQPDRLQDALARALHDPTLKVAYWARESQRFVDVTGQPVDTPPARGDRVATRIERDGELIALVLHDRALLDDPELVDASIAAARLALDNERLHADVSAQLQEVRASRARIVNVRDAERQRLERDLHDGAQQRLVTLSLALKLLQARMSDGADPQAESTLQDAIAELSVALSELRELARGIHPAILTEAGLRAALRSLAERMPIPTTVEVDLNERLPVQVEVAAYYVASEALANIAKHARASRAAVEVAREGELLRVSVSDDGTGGAELARGSGLVGMADRVRALDGQLEIDSPLGGGTRISATVPCSG